MRTFRGFHHPDVNKACALTIGNFDGVHQGHQAMIRHLLSRAKALGVPSCVLTFEPHPRNYFAKRLAKPELAPARVSTLRDKLAELERCGVDQCVVLPFNEQLASLSPEAFVQSVLIQGLGAKFVLIGDDFKYGAKRAGDYTTLEQAGALHGFEVARMSSFELNGVRVSSSEVRAALVRGDLEQVQTLLGRAYAISGHVVHGRHLGRELGCRTLNVRFSSGALLHCTSAAQGIFVVEVEGLTPQPLQAVANLGVRPSLDASDVNQGRVLLESHVLDWPSHLGLNAGYGRVVKVNLLHKLHDELKYESLDALKQGIERDCEQAREWFSKQKRTI
jgi:riboflavin kinase/FMN adenylyltransferase